MNVGKNRQWILNARPTGKLTEEKFRWNEISEPGPANYFNLVARRGCMEGFIGLDYGPRFPQAIEAPGLWQREGKLVQKEDIVMGTENAP